LLVFIIPSCVRYSIDKYNVACYYQSACRAAAEHCSKKGKSITKLAMQYSLMNNEISTVLVGMNSSKQVHISFLYFALYAAYSQSVTNKL